MVEIRALAFYSCGSSHIDTISQSLSEELKAAENVAPAISALFIPNFHLVSCYMKHNYLPIYMYLNNSRMYSIDNHFAHNKGSLGGAIAAYISMHCCVLGQNLFLGNEAVVGGGVFVERSELEFRGLTAFINDTADYGGGIGVDNSSLLYGDLSNNSSSCNRTHATTVFIQNLAQSRGGGMWLIRSVVQQSGGNLNFTMNQAADKGGGIFSDSSLIRLVSYVVLGSVSVQVSTWNSTVVTFVGNSAYDGGAVYSLYSNLNFGTPVNTGPQNIGSQLSCPFMRHCYQNTYRNNSADHGGALHAYRSTIELNGGTGHF